MINIFDSIKRKQKVNVQIGLTVHFCLRTILYMRSFRVFVMQNNNMFGRTECLKSDSCGALVCLSTCCCQYCVVLCANNATCCTTLCARIFSRHKHTNTYTHTCKSQTSPASVWHCTTFRLQLVTV